MFGFAAIRAGNGAMGLMSATDSFLGMQLSVSESFFIGVALVAFVLVAVFVVLIGWRATVRAGGRHVVCAVGDDVVEQCVARDAAAPG